jgi:hypothetical protein
LMLILGAMVGFLVSLALLLWGLRSGDRWLAAVAGIALVFSWEGLDDSRGRCSEQYQRPESSGGAAVLMGRRDGALKIRRGAA